jgi:Glycosyltransferase family 87
VFTELRFRAGGGGRVPRRLALQLSAGALAAHHAAGAGGLLGLLIYKPQLGLLIPVALLAGRHWRASEGVAVSLR